jgi:hypothetical protein
MNTRLQTILRWCDRRGISHVVAFFRGCSDQPQMYDAHYARIGAVLRGKVSQVQDTDDTWISDMEATINKLSK